ncbi:MAG TPA: hypothetical protein VHM19_13245 [Polyangiales bacterium]|jgi:hypothetical protein|nr:hypothetical protein [Polyangiales bacterium]
MVSARDRRHFDAIRKAKQAEREERLVETLARDPIESMREGLALGAGKVDAAVERLLDQRALGQAELAKRGRALGMREHDGRHPKAPR